MDNYPRAIRNKRGLGSLRTGRLLGLKLFVLLLFAGLLNPLFSAVRAGPIFIDQEQWEGPPDIPPREVRALPVIIKNTATKMMEPYTLDLGNGLNAEEAAILAVITHPYIVSVREKKGLGIPQFMNAGLLPPPRLSALEGASAGSWLPTDRLQLFKETASRMAVHKVDERLELESAWLEWQASEAARLSVYRKINSRRIIDLLRQIEKLYKDIYKTTSKAGYKEQYREMRATARLGFDKMKKAGKAERKALSASRAELNHALSLPTNFNVPIESGVAFTWPETIPSEKELIRNMPFRRIDFIALQGGIAEKNPELMNYILSRFNAINVSLMADTKAQWLVAGAPGVYITFPLFGANHGVADMRATNDELLTKNYKNRLKVATLQVSRLSNGLAFIIGELQRIDSILPAVTQDAREHADKKSPVMALQKQKTLLAVRLLRLRLLRKLMDTGFALEIASGTRIFETHLISDTPSTLQGKKSK